MPVFQRIISLGRFRIAIALALFIAVGPATALEPIRLQLKWQHQFQFAGYYVALEKGYYREAGMDVTILPAEPGEDSASKVLAGQAEFGVGTSELLQRRERGEPLVALAVIFQHSPLALAALKKQGEQDLHDLVGQRLMIEPDSAELMAMLKREQIGNKDITLLPHSYSMAELVNRKVAAMSVYTTDELYELQQIKQPYVLYSPRQAGIDFYGDNLFTTEQQIRQHPDRVRAFREASLKGWAYAMKHPDEIADLIHNNYASPHSLDHLKWEAAQMKELMHADIVEIGHMYPGRWQHIAGVYAELGMLKTDFRLDGFLYDPNPPPPDRTWLFVTIGGLLLVSLAIGGNAIFVFRTNRQLSEANAKTQSLLEDQHQFVRVISHEVRGPLAAIDAAAQVLELRCQDNDQTLEPLRRIQRGVQRLIGVVDNCLVDDRLNSLIDRGLKLPDETIDLPAFLATLLHHSADDAPTHHLRLEAAADLGQYRGDATLLRVMLSNLLGNAIKYSPPGSAVVLHAERINDGGLRLAVADTGPGIAPEDIEGVRKRYYRGANRGQTSGSGLGLFLVNQIAGVHGGTMQIDNTPGQGTTVAITLPARPPAAEASS